MSTVTYYTTPFSITSQFAFCGLPLRLDTYRGCGFQCSYCFARNRGGNSPGETIRPANFKQIDTILERALNQNGKGVIAEFLRRRTPIHFGGMSDPFQPAELKHRVTASALRSLGRYHYPTVLSTRGSMMVHSPYLQLLKTLGPVVIQFSFSSTRDSTAAQIEPNSTPPSTLLRAMEALSKHAIAVTCRWQPYIPGVSEAPVEFVERVAATGCRHVALEYLKLPLERDKRLWREFAAATGRDFFEEYRLMGARRDGREMILSPLHKLAVVLEVRRQVRKNHMSFGAADNEFQYLSDTSCCCSGVDQFPGFENWFRHQIGFAVRQSCDKEIRYSVLEKEWAPTGSINRYLNSRSRIPSSKDNNGAIRDHVRERWNRLDSPGSPATFFGVVPKDDFDPTRRRPMAYKWDFESLDLRTVRLRD
jgi:DNA repair photolyase